MMLRTSLALALTCSALFLAAPVGAGPVEDGENALAQGRTEMAIRFFKIAIQANPDDARAWAGYERAARGLGTDRPVTGGAAAAVEAGAPLAVGAEIEGGRTPHPSRVEGNAFERYKRGEPVFFNPDFKNLIAGKRLENKATAAAFYEQRRNMTTRLYRRKKGGRIDGACTLFSPELYAYFACVRAHQLKLDKAGAEEVWERDSARAFKLLEFFVDLENRTYEGGIQANRQVVNLDGIERQVFLEDDRGVRYLPYEVTKPKSPLLRDKEQITAWFAPFDRSGNAIWENAVSELRLVIEGIEGEAEKISFGFPKVMFRRMLQGERL